MQTVVSICRMYSRNFPYIFATTRKDATNTPMTSKDSFKMAVRFQGMDAFKVVLFVLLKYSSWLKATTSKDAI